MRHLLRYSICYLLTILVALPTGAQEQNAAFYIYQNDGHFDGFFYDQVKKISYSKLDTLGIEHGDYVSQEIVTEDSIYRIMLTAIDSVSFVQPEIIINPHVRILERDGLMTYVTNVSDDHRTLTFSNDMPETLRPKTDDVLLCFDFEKYEDGFGGKVFTVNPSGEGLIVKLEPIKDLGDVFQQFITVEQIVKDNSGAPAQCRMAGADKMRRAQGNWSVDPYNFSADFKTSLSFSDAITGSLGLHFGFGLGGSFVYNITSSEFFIKAELTETLDLGVNAELDLKLYGNDDYKDNLLTSGGVLSKLASALALPFPAQLPVGKLMMTPLPFLRAEGHIKTGIGFNLQSKKLKQSFTIKDGRLEDWSLIDRDAEAVDPDWSFSAEVNGFVQFGLMTPFEVKTIEWLENIIQGKIGATLYTGPKVSGNLTVDLKQMSNVGGLYQSLKSSSIQFSRTSVDFALEAKIGSIFGKEVKLSREWSHAFGTMKWGIFPEFEPAHNVIDPKYPRRIDVSFGVSGDVLFDQKLGVGLYDLDGKLITSKIKDEEYTMFNTFNSVSAQFDDLKNGNYHVVPLISGHTIFGDDIPAYFDSEEKELWIEINGPELIASQTKFNVGPEAQTLTSELSTNAKTLTVKSSAAWVEVDRQGLIVNMNVSPLDVDNGVRTATVTVHATFEDSSDQDLTIDIMQSTDPNYPVVVITPDSLEFDAAPGQKMVRVVTNGEQPTCDATADWIHPTLIGNKLTVDVDGTSKARDRFGAVYVRGHMGDLECTELLEIVQHGAIALSKYKLYYTADGAEEEIQVKLGGNFKVTVKTDDDWLKPEYADGNIKLITEPNYGSAARTGKVIVTALVDGQEVSVELVVYEQSYITLTPSYLSVNKEGDVLGVYIETTLTDLEIEAVNNWIGVALSEDRRRMTVSISENNTNQSRQGKAVVKGKKGDITISVAVIVYQSEGEEATGELQILNQFVSLPPLNVVPRAIMYQYPYDDIVFETSESWLWVEPSDETTPGPNGLYNKAMVCADDYTEDSGQPRTAFVYVTAGGITQEVEVSQQSIAELKPYVSVTGSRQFDYMDDPHTMTIIPTNCSKIRVHDNASWIHTDLDGYLLTVTVDDNLSDDERTGTITIVGYNDYGRGKTEIEITQNAYGGKILDPGYDGVMFYLEGSQGDGYNYYRWLPDLSHWEGTHQVNNHEGVYGVSTVSGNVIVDKKHEANYIVNFYANGYVDSDHYWTVNLNIDHNGVILNGSVSYHDHSKTFVIRNLPTDNPDRIVPAPIDLSFVLDSIPPDKHAYIHRNYWHDYSGGGAPVQRYYNHSVWEAEYTNSVDIGPVSAFTFVDGVELVSPEATEVRPRDFSGQPCKIYIYLRPKGIKPGDDSPLPYGYLGM